MREASRCGTCDVRATALSCSVGVNITGTAPQTSTSAATRTYGPSGRGAVVPADGPRAAGEQVGGRRERSGPLTARHRVAADVPRCGRVRGDLSERSRLHAAHVRDDRVAARRVERSGDRVAEVVGRDRDHDQCGLVTRRLRARPAPKP